MTVINGVVYGIEVVKKKSGRVEFFYFDKIETKIDFINNVLSKSEYLQREFDAHINSIEDDRFILTKADKCNLSYLKANEYKELHQEAFRQWKNIIDSEVIM